MHNCYFTNNILKISGIAQFTQDQQEKATMGQYDRLRGRSGSRHRSSRKRSRSRSRSPYRSRRRSSRHRSPKEQHQEEPKPSARSRSPYNSRYDDGYRGGYDRDRDRGYDRGPRYRSRAPMSRCHRQSREDPKESRCLGVFGLSMYTQERELRDLFSRYGPIDDWQVVYDHQTGRSRGFAFLYMRNMDDAIEAKEMVAGSELDGHKIRVDFSITKRAHTPTPGIYLGRSTRGSGYRGGRDRGGGGSGYHRRSSSPYYGGHRGGPVGYSHSRSCSYSPRPRY